MKVELKLMADDLAYLDFLLAPLAAITAAQFRHRKPAQRLLLSIIIDVADKFGGKYQNLSRKPTLFDAKKKHKVTIKYHEAHALHAFLADAIGSETDIYKKNIARKIHGFIDPQLL
jgi:hypothetical protein